MRYDRFDLERITEEVAERKRILKETHTRMREIRSELEALANSIPEQRRLLASAKGLWNVLNYLLNGKGVAGAIEVQPGFPLVEAPQGTAPDGAGDQAAEPEARDRVLDAEGTPLRPADEETDQELPGPAVP